MQTILLHDLIMGGAKAKIVCMQSPFIIKQSHIYSKHTVPPIHLEGNCTTQVPAFGHWRTLVHTPVSGFFFWTHMHKSVCVSCICVPVSLPAYKHELCLPVGSMQKLRCGELSYQSSRLKFPGDVPLINVQTGSLHSVLGENEQLGGFRAKNTISTSPCLNPPVTLFHSSPPTPISTAALRWQQRDDSRRGACIGY